MNTNWGRGGNVPRCPDREAPGLGVPGPGGLPFPGVLS